MRYTELIVTVAAPDADSAADLLREITDAGIWLDAPFVQEDLESDAVVDHSADVRLHAYLPDDGDAAGAALRMQEALTAAGVRATLTRAAVAEEDWADSWKEHFQVERYGSRIVIVPSWRAYTARSDDLVLTLDPGMAFGTGQHETTRMCLEALEPAVTDGARVLDVGCGSGILSIAAARLGARETLAVDVDANCVRVTNENARLNHVERAARAAQGSAGAGWPFDPGAAAGFDVVVVNIIARIIIDLADALVAALAPHGRLIASGIIGEREHDVVEALTAARARVISTRSMGDWRCIEAVRSGSGPSA